MIYAGDSSRDPEHTPCYSEAIEDAGKLQFPSDIVAKAVRMARVMCTDGDSDEDIRSRILRLEHRNVFPIRAASTTSDRTS